jgi:hypothetical protein
MKVSNENKVLIGVGVFAVAGLGFLYWKKKQNEKQVDEIPSYLPEENTKSVATKSVATKSVATKSVATKSVTTKSVAIELDRNKLLGKGSKGAEVLELQNLLNVKSDGDFGNITLTALQKAKGVSEISLNAFQSKTNIKPTLATKSKAVASIITPKKDAKLMVSSKSTSLYISKKLANGSYSNTGKKMWAGGDLVYGDAVGIFKKATANGTFLVQKDGGYYFVNGKHVKPY